MFNVKKIATSIAAAALMMGVSTSAFAAFADLELIRVIYDRNGSEIATDLGNIKSLLSTGGTFGGSFGSLTTGYVAYFALDRANNDLWASGSATVPSIINGTTNGLTSLKSGTTFMYSLYNTQGGTNYTGLASAQNSFKNKLSATQGNLANSISNVSRFNTEASIASLIANGTGSVTQGLYFWSDATSTTTAGKTGVLAATITTSANGTTITTTPIPAAIYLMGSGLLGLVGLRRRKEA